MISERLDALQHDTYQSQRAAFAAGTHANLRTQWRTYIMFCAYFGLIAAPAEPQTLCMYSQFLGRSFVSITAVRNYLNGVRLWHLYRGEDFPSTSFILNLTLRGLGKHLFRQPRQAPAIMPQHLLAIWRVMCFECPWDATMFCLFLFAFFLMARKSTLTPPSASLFSPAKYPTRQDVRLTHFGMVVTLKYSKTNQFGFSNYSVPLVSIPNSPLCPVRAYKLMLALLPAPPLAPLFCLPNTPCTPVTHPNFQSHLERALRSANLSSLHFTGHSFRRGGASWAFRVGVPGELIQSIGGWTSDAYLRYLDFSLSSKVNAAQTFAAALPSVH